MWDSECLLSQQEERDEREPVYYVCIPPPRGPKKSSTFLPPGPSGGTVEGARLTEAEELGLIISETGWLGPDCLNT